MLKPITAHLLLSLPVLVLTSPAQNSAFSSGGSPLFRNPSLQPYRGPANSGIAPVQSDSSVQTGTAVPVGASVSNLQQPPSLFAAQSGNATSAIGTPGYAVFPGLGLLQNIAENPLQWGPFSVHPHANYAFTYATGLNFAPGNVTDTITHTVSPGLTLQSKHLSLDYTPSLVFYQKGPYSDTVNHNVRFSANWGYDQWKFGVSHNYSQASQPLIETGTQTDTQNNATSATASWYYNQKISFDFSISQDIQEASGFNNSRSWSTMEWANYHLTDKTTVGLGVGGGYSDVDFGSNMAFEQYQARLGWSPSPKIAVNLNGGIEVRQFLDINGAGDRINPLMGASINYAPFDATSLSLSANRSVSTSLFQDQITENTIISAGLSQRFLGRYNFSVSGGFRTSEYQTTSRFLAVDRSDDTTFVTVGLGTSIFKRGSIGVSYQHSSNTSNQGGFSYDSDQYTASIGYSF